MIFEEALKKMSGKCYHVLVVNDSVTMRRRIRTGTCTIIIGEDVVFNGKSIRYANQNSYSHWNSYFVGRTKNKLFVLYKYLSSHRDTGRGLMELSINNDPENGLSLEGFFDDLYPRKNNGFVRIFKDKLMADQYLSDAIGPDNVDIRVFMCYSHADKKHLNLFLEYIEPTLKKEGFMFWHDQKLRTSENWDTSIKSEINRADISIVLVSQSFLNSDYCQRIEVPEFIKLRKDTGLKIFPIILSDCDWETHSWLSSIQFQPRDGKTIKGNYKTPEKRASLYKEILADLRYLGNEIKEKRIEELRDSTDK